MHCSQFVWENLIFINLHFLSNCSAIIRSLILHISVCAKWIIPSLERDSLATNISISLYSVFIIWEYYIYSLVYHDYFNYRRLCCILKWWNVIDKGATFNLLQLYKWIHSTYMLVKNKSLQINPLCNCNQPATGCQITASHIDL